MTTAKEGMELTRVGPGTVMGELMRHYWIPGGHVLGARARRRARPPDAARREADRVSRQRRPGRRDGPSLPAPLRVAVPGTQRGGRHPLHLSRLEVRRRRQLPRHAEPAAAGLQAEGEGQGLQGGRARRRRLGLHGVARGGAAAAGVRDPRRARGRDQGQLHPARLQLSAGARGRDRHLAFRLPACRPRRPRRPGRGRAGPAHRHQPRAGVPHGRCALGHAVRRLPRGRARHRPTGASAISCFRSGRRRPTASSAATCMRAPGCRSTTSTRCSASSGGSAAVSAMSLPQPAFKDGTPIGGTGRGNKMLPNTTDWLGRWRLAAEREQRLGHRPRGPAEQRRSTAASTASTCRTRRSPRAWAPIVDHAFEHLAPSTR